MNIVMVAGEVSGDLLGGKLAEELYKINQVDRISGIGGDMMRQAKVTTLHDVSETSVVGIAEVLKHYPRLRKILSSIKQHIKKIRPDLLILIDYPEFNLKLAKYAKSLNIKVLFYVSPQVWAWRTKRVKTIKSRVDLMAVLFPFEVDFYTAENIPVCQVRHPLLQEIDQHFSASNIDNKSITLGLAPGSRANEIKKLFPIMIEAASMLSNDYKDLQFITPVAPGIKISDLEALNTSKLSIKYSQENFYQTIKVCDAVAITSGTATLQTALMGKAMTVIYKISPITYKLFGHMVKVDHISLANIILQRRAYPELIQNEATSENLYRSLKALIDDKMTAKHMQINQSEIYKNLDSGINSKELATKAVELAS